MRLTIDLPAEAHRRVHELAASRDQSVSAVIVELILRGLHEVDADIEITRDPVSGLPTIGVGRTITAEGVADSLDE